MGSTYSVQSLGLELLVEVAQIGQTHHPASFV